MNHIIDLNINSETGQLKSVILGIANNRSLVKYKINPKYAEVVDSGHEPVEEILVKEIEEFSNILKSNGVEVYRPTNINECTQIFTRDIGFVIGDTFVRGKLRHESRLIEIDAIEFLISRMNKVLSPPTDVIIEGGDIILWNEYVFVGQGDRTNLAGYSFLKENFDEAKQVEPIHIKVTNKGNSNILHLDCAFQPVGNEFAIIFEDGFTKRPDIIYDLFPDKNLIKVNHKEMYDMFPNIFSVSPTTVIIESKFSRLIQELEKKGLKVIKVDYENISKLGGLLRCSTLPLSRIN